MTLKQMPKVGDKVRYLGGMYDENIHCITEGDTYEIQGVDDEGHTYYFDDEGDRWFIQHDALKYYELVTESAEPTPVEASPTVIELLANISRRLYEAEQTIKEQAYEINELYREVADRG